MALTEKRQLYKKFPSAPNFLDRIGLPDEDVKLIMNAKDSISESERFWYDVICSYHDFLKGRFISSRDILVKLVGNTPQHEIDKHRLLHLNLALIYFNLWDEYRNKRKCENSSGVEVCEGEYVKKAKESFELAKNLRKDPRDELHIKILIARGFFLNSQEKYPDVVKTFAMARNLAEEISYLEGVAKCYDGIGAMYLKRGELDEDIHYLGKALEIYEETGKVDGILEIQHNIAFAYWKKAPQKKLGDLRKIVSKLRAHMEYTKKMGDYKVVAVVCENIANVYEEFGNTELEKHYRNEAMRIRKDFQIM